jgi:hypothetical protein
MPAAFDKALPRQLEVPPPHQTHVPTFQRVSGGVLRRQVMPASTDSTALLASKSRRFQKTETGLPCLSSHAELLTIRVIDRRIALILRRRICTLILRLQDEGNRSRVETA